MDRKKVKKGEKYKLEDILEMLGGEKYYSMQQIMYIYHASNDNMEEALHYKKLCVENAQKENEKYSVLKTEEEIKAINSNIKDESYNIGVCEEKHCD
jgi:hypothetical protein